MFKISDEQGPDIVRIFEDRLPIGFVPIGSDPGGNVLCIGTDDEFTGKIYFRDHQKKRPMWSITFSLNNLQD
ncbi:hypothetical protein A3842_29585 [Paenibacillus sp. P3E]|nr:hypothetical protein A3842_29585 [Paenibacillus sp. P3E]